MTEHEQLKHQLVAIEVLLGDLTKGMVKVNEAMSRFPVSGKSDHAATRVEVAFGRLADRLCEVVEQFDVDTSGMPTSLSAFRKYMAEQCPSIVEGSQTWLNRRSGWNAAAGLFIAKVYPGRTCDELERCFRELKEPV